MKRYLRPADVAAMLQISRRATYRLLHELPRLQIGRSIRVAEEDLQAYLAKRTLKPWSAEKTPPEYSEPGWLRPIVPRTKPRPPSAEVSNSRRPIVPRTKPRPR